MPGNYVFSNSQPYLPLSFNSHIDKLSTTTLLSFTLLLLDTKKIVYVIETLLKYRPMYLNNFKCKS